MKPSKKLKQKRLWNEKDLAVWRKSLVGKTWEIYWEPSSQEEDEDNDSNDDRIYTKHINSNKTKSSKTKKYNGYDSEGSSYSSGDDHHDNELTTDDDSEEGGEYEADWYDGYIQSYSQKTKQFKIVFVGEEDVFYCMKLKPNIVRPLEKKSDDDEKIMSDNEMMEDNECEENSISSEEVEFDDYNDDFKMDSDSEEEENEDTCESDEVCIPQSSLSTKKRKNETTKNHNSDDDITSNKSDQSSSEESLQPSSKKRKYNIEQNMKMDNSRDRSMTTKIKKKQRKQMNLIRNINHTRMTVKKDASLSEELKRRDQSIIQKQVKQLKNSPPIVKMTKTLCENNSVLASSSQKASNTSSLHRASSLDQQVQSSKKPICQNKKRPRPVDAASMTSTSSSFLAKTLGMISNKEDKLKETLDVNKQQEDGRVSPPSSQNQHVEARSTTNKNRDPPHEVTRSSSSSSSLPPPSSFLKSFCNIKNEESTSLVTKKNEGHPVFLPPQGAFPQCTVSSPPITKKEEPSFSIVKVENESKFMQRNGRNNLAKKMKIAHVEKTRLKQEITSILSRQPKYSTSIKKCDDEPRKEVGMKLDPYSSSLNKTNVLSLLCSNIVRKVKFAEHLNETRHYTADEVKSLDEDNVKSEQIGNDEEMMHHHEQEIIIDKFITKKQDPSSIQNQEPADETKHLLVANDERKKKKLLAYSAVNGTIDEMMTCLHNGASARGGRGEKPLEKVKEARTKLQKELDQYSKRNKAMNNIINLSNQISRKIILLDKLWKNNRCHRNYYMTNRKRLGQIETKIQNDGRSIGLYFRFDPTTSSFLTSDTQATKIKSDILKIRLEDLQRKYTILKIYKEIEIIAEMARSLHPKLQAIDRSSDSFKQKRKDCAKRINIVCGWIKRFQEDLSRIGGTATTSNMNSTSIDSQDESDDVSTSSGSDQEATIDLSSTINVNISQFGGFTMLHSAACIFAINSIHDLLRLGATTTIRSDEFGTVLELAKDLCDEAKSRRDRKYENAYKDVLQHLR